MVDGLEILSDKVQSLITMVLGEIKKYRKEYIDLEQST